MEFPGKGLQRKPLLCPILKEGVQWVRQSPKEPQHLLPWVSPALGCAVGYKGSGKEEATPSQPDWP